MNKQLKGIIGLGAVLVVLGGGLAALKLTDNSDKDSSSSSSEFTEEKTTRVYGEGIVLVEDSTAQPITPDQIPPDDTDWHMHPAQGIVETLDITNEEGQFTVVKVGYDETRIDEAGNPAMNYTIKGYEDVSMDMPLIGTLVDNVNGITAASVIEENCKDLSKFGLDAPAITAEMKFEDGVVRKYYVGIKNPATPGQTYFKIDGNDTVYTVSDSKLANYYKKPDDFINRQMLEKSSDNNDPIVRSVVIERDDIDYNIVIEYGKNSDDSNAGGSSAKHELIEPVHAYLAVERSESVTNGMFGFTADTVYAVHCTDDDIKNAGLDDPYCRVTMKCDGADEPYVMIFSKVYTNEDDETDRRTNVMLEGGNVIYTISESLVPWINVMPIDIASRLIMTSQVWNIDSMIYETADGRREEFKITPKKNMVRANGDSDDFDVTRNGKLIDSERYRRLYSFLVQSNGEEFALDAEIPSGKPMVSVEYNDCYLNEKHTVEFYDYSAMKTLIVFDGSPKFYGVKSYAQTLADNIARLDTNEEFVTTWK
ncbi:MAG: DUF4340 domain-containing protein [Ruminococcus sp.]|nr:DUF4340 domain-containing protein [Ruminococcus sp.]